MSKENPTSFEDLETKELYRSAVEDFAAAVDEADKGKKKVLLAALVEAGVEWSDYVAQHPEVVPEKPVYQPTPNQTVETVEPLEGFPEEEVAVVQAPVQVQVQQPIAQNDQPYLIRMTRDNLVFETRGYRFTKDHPYALVSAKDAQFILSKEDGFRQAFPAELDEFYERAK